MHTDAINAGMLLNRETILFTAIDAPAPIRGAHRQSFELLVEFRAVGRSRQDARP